MFAERERAYDQLLRELWSHQQASLDHVIEQQLSPPRRRCWGQPEPEPKPELEQELELELELGPPASQLLLSSLAPLPLSSTETSRIQLTTTKRLASQYFLSIMCNMALFPQWGSL